MPASDYTPRPYNGPSREEVLAMRKQYANPALFTMFKDPIMIVEGHMQWLFDEKGKRWTLETAFQHLEAYFHSEINTLGYPKAALFGFCLALVAYNMLAVVMAALASGYLF